MEVNVATELNVLYPLSILFVFVETKLESCVLKDELKSKYKALPDPMTPFDCKFNAMFKYCGFVSKE
jgi:hypothetical protein